MSEWDYINARARGMASRLLPAELLDQIAQAEGEDIFVDLLMGSGYAQALTDSLASAGGTDATEAALKRELFSSLEGLRKLTAGTPRKLIDMQLGFWDLANVIALVRGKRRGLPSEEIARSLVPAGCLHPAQLASLAKESGLSDLVDALSTWGYGLAPQLRKALRGGEAAIPLPELEHELQGEYLAKSHAALDPKDSNEAILLGQLALQVDELNVKALLMGVARRTNGLRPEPARLLPGGAMKRGILEAIEGAADLEHALEFLESSAFAPAIERGILAFGQAKRLGVLERFLEAEVIKAGMRLFRGDPLSAGIPLGYLWRKYAEFLNLRVLLRGKRYGMPPNAIREALVLA